MKLDDIEKRRFISKHILTKHYDKVYKMLGNYRLIKRKNMIVVYNTKYITAWFIGNEEKYYKGLRI